MIPGQSLCGDSPLSQITPSQITANQLNALCESSHSLSISNSFLKHYIEDKCKSLDVTISVNYLPKSVIHLKILVIQDVALLQAQTCDQEHSALTSTTTSAGRFNRYTNYNFSLQLNKSSAFHLSQR